MSLSRRDFVAGAVGTVISSALPVQSKKTAERIARRPFGKTGFQASIYALGSAEIPGNEEAIPAIRSLIAAGVNYIDTAPSYQGTRSETAIGAAIEGRRQDLFIATKTLERSAEGAYREVCESLERLKCKHIDLLQVHAVNDFATLDRVLAKGGAVEGLERARKEGLIRHIGITGHTAPEVILRAIGAYPFAAILIPISALDFHVSDFATEVLPKAKELGIGIAGMKSLKGMEIASGGKFSPEPLIRYALSHPISTLTLGLRRSSEVEQNLAFFKAFKPMIASEMTDLREQVKPQSTVQNLWWKRR
ncbi:MAG TPA: aldo/keto reductase [Fimbriimonadaceae bacterium]|nr:aldo/keto reductase [Fimbriimonadaceae bacterium]